MLTSYEDRFAFLQKFGDGSLAFHAKNPKAIHIKGNGWELISNGSKFAMFNAVLIWSGRKDLVGEVISSLKEHNIPADIRLVGPGIGHTEALAEHGYQNLGGNPFMVWRADSSVDTFKLRDGLRVRRLGEADIEQMCVIYADVYRMNDEMILDLQKMLFATSNDYTYGLFKDEEMVSLVTAMVYLDTVGIWSMGTPTSQQRNGFGRELLMQVMKTHAEMGARDFFLYASSAGKHLYDKCGWMTLDYLPYLSRVNKAPEPSSLIS